MRLRKLKILFMVVGTIVAAASPAYSAETVPVRDLGALETVDELPTGEIYRVTFSDWSGPTIPVWIYLPSDVSIETAPILMMMHGAKRDAHRYLREWRDPADQNGFVVIAPEFSKRNFDRSLRYNLGFVFDTAGTARDESLWTFSAIEPIFDAVRESIGSQRESYSLYGHSAGSQFVHRYLLYKPDARVDTYLAANAGWYTLPDLEIAYPYGLKGSGVDPATMHAALGKRVVILLGDQDNDPSHSSLRRTSEAMDQGEHRLARGLTYFESARREADIASVPFNWTLRIVEGVAHKNGGIAPAAAEYID